MLHVVASHVFIFKRIVSVRCFFLNLKCITLLFSATMFSHKIFYECERARFHVAQTQFTHHGCESAQSKSRF